MRQAAPAVPCASAEEVSAAYKIIAALFAANPKAAGLVAVAHRHDRLVILKMLRLHEDFADVRFLPPQ